jgi:flagellar biosynthesis/type III secretory pathway protein FliH
LYPEYYVLRVNDFDKKSSTPLDEWILFLKTGDIPETATAAGLPEARERLRMDRMSEAERQKYKVHMEALRYQRSVIQTGIIEGRAEGIAEGRAEGELISLEKTVLNGKRNGFSLEQIQLFTNLSMEKILEILELHGEKI